MALPQPCTKASLACGRTSSGAACPSGVTSILSSNDTWATSLTTSPCAISTAPSTAVQPSLIRVDADEVTYGLHVIIRFELECDLLEGKLRISELPDAWNAKYAEFLGVRPKDYRNGVMQDVHWYADYIGGMFQGYALGNVLGSQFYGAALQAHPEIPAEIEAGRFDILHNWLQTNIYRHLAVSTPRQSW